MFPPKLPKISYLPHSIFAMSHRFSHRNHISPSLLHRSPIQTATKLLKTYEPNFTHFPRTNSCDDKDLDVNLSIVDNEEIFEGL